MSTVVHEQVHVPVEGLRISWGGIWAGVLTVLGLLMFFTTLGLAVGITAADPGDTDAGALGTGAAIWTGLSLLIALFLGGMAAARLGLVFDKAAASSEGALVWVLSFIAILWLASAGVRLVASGISGLFGGVTQTIGSATDGMQNLSSGNVDQILARLRDPQTARMMASATGASEQEMTSRLNDIAGRVEAARDNPEQAAAEMRRGTQELVNGAKAQLPAIAERVQEGATKTAWGALAAMLISLAAAVAGAMVGRRGAARRLVREETFTTTRTV